MFRVDNKIILIFGIILFYLFFGLIYLSVGNTLYKLNNEELPVLHNQELKNPVAKALLNEDTETMLSFVVNSVNGYDDENLKWINYLFIFISALLIFTIVIVAVHG